MVHVLKLSTAVRNDCADAVRNRLGSGPFAGIIRFYDGTIPANPQTAIAGNNLLATLTFSDPAATSAVDGVGTYNPVLVGICVFAGTPTWARALNSDGIDAVDTAFDCNVGELPGASEAILFDDTTFLLGNNINLATGGTVTMPES